MSVPFKITDEILAEYKKEEFKLFFYPRVSEEEKEAIWAKLEQKFKTRCEVRNRVQGWFEKYNQVKVEKIKNLWCLDITPYDDISKPRLGVERFKQLVLQIFKEKWFKSYYFVFEQRGDSDETVGNGIHCHAIIEFNDPKQGFSRYKQNIVNIVKKKKYDEWLPEHLINFKKIETEVQRDNRIKYINPYHFGKGEEKLNKWTYDSVMRKKWDIKDYYESNSLLPLPTPVDG